MNFNSPQGDTAPIDLHMPETFHRLKRTVLLLCSALILLALGTAPEKSTLTIPFFTIELPAIVVRSLLWAATAYYFVGFLMETSIVRLINSDVMIGAGMKSVDKAMQKLGATFNDIDERVEAAAQGAQSECQKLSVLNNDLASPEDFVAAIHGAANQAPPHQADLHGRIEYVIQRQIAAADAARLGVGRIAVATESIAGDHEKLRTLLTDTHESINKLSKRISGERKFSFWVWEVGGVVGAVFAAIAFNQAWLLQRIDWMADTALRTWNSIA